MSKSPITLSNIAKVHVMGQVKFHCKTDFSTRVFAITVSLSIAKIRVIDQVKFDWLIDFL